MTASLTPTVNAAVVLLSGGLDSTVALAETLSRMPIARVLTFDYGQSAAPKERAAAKAIATHYKLEHQVIPLPWLTEILPTALTPEYAMSGAQKAQNQPLSREEWFDVNQVWVPNRNGVFLNIAAAFAEALNAGVVVFGANAEEGASFPDNSLEFRNRLNESLAYSTLKGVRVETPMGDLNKDDIIRHGLDLDVPFHLIWSCYVSDETQCGQCSSCLRVKEARDRVAKASGKTAEISFAD